MAVAVVYAIGSRQIRRVIVTDGAAPDGALSEGEAMLDVPQETYDQSNAYALNAYVAAQSGAPTSDGDGPPGDVDSSPDF